ncbi:MAG TPA: crossover junction endodeoxyribonuclease RuvC [Actinobacteria bacterium]|nr:crossover junction endodeoxyribonuclease RuvC [Actinomycetota bacterium]
MRVLGIDPGLTRCGLGVVDGGSGRALTLVEVGVAGSESSVDLHHRLATIYDAVCEWIHRHEPDSIAIERVFSQHNLRTVMGTAQAGAVALLAAAQADIPVALHTPSEVKAAVTGHGRANKEQVGTMVARLLRMDSPPRPADAADALALAICHLWRGGAQQRIEQARAAALAGRGSP